MRSLIKRFGFDETQALQESLVEAISQKEPKEIARKLRVPNGEALITDIYHRLVRQNSRGQFENPLYKYLPQGMILVETRGTRETYWLFKENPFKYREEILRLYETTTSLACQRLA